MTTLPSISTSTQSTPQLQRAWALLLVCSLFPTAKPDVALAMACWIFDGRTGARS